jgi:hypothetical protein
MNAYIVTLAFVSSVLSIILLFNYSPLKQKLVSNVKDIFGQLNQKQLSLHEIKSVKYSVNLMKNITYFSIIFFAVFLFFYFMFVIVFGLIANQYPNESNIKTLSYYQTHEVKNKQIYLECYNQFIKDDMNDKKKQQFFWKCLKEKF